MSSKAKSKEALVATIVISNPRLNIVEDASSYIKEMEKLNRNRLAYAYGGGSSCYDLTDEEMKDWEDYWRGLGYNVDGFYDDDYDSDYSYYDNDIETVWPPKGNNADIVNSVGKHGYDPDSKKRRDKKKKNKGGIQPIRCINGIEVDEESFERYNKDMRHASDVVNGKNNKRGGRGKKKSKKVRNLDGSNPNIRHSSNRATRYNYEDWEENHQRPTSSLYNECEDSIFADEVKKIVFHRDMMDENDCYEFDSLHDFSEFCTENNIMVKDDDISSFLYREESHCCIDVTSDSIDGLRLTSARSFGDLVWDVTGGDEDLMMQYRSSIPEAAKSI